MLYKWKLLMPRVLIAIGLIFLSALSYSQPKLEIIKKQNSVLIGKMHLTYFFFSIYDARLYSHKKPFSFHQPFILEITYLRDFSSQAIAKESIKQIKRQNPTLSQTTLAQWQKQLAQIFPNIKENDQLIGYYSTEGYSYFYDKNAKFLGEIKNKQFSRYFYDIWLSNKSENQSLSRELRGLK